MSCEINQGITCESNYVWKADKLVSNLAAAYELLLNGYILSMKA